MEDHHFSLGPLQLNRLTEDHPGQMLANLRIELDLNLENQRAMMGSYRGNSLECDEPLFHEDYDGLGLGPDLKLGGKKWDPEQHPLEAQVAEQLQKKVEAKEESVDSLTKNAHGNPR